MNDAQAERLIKAIERVAAALERQSQPARPPQPTPEYPSTYRVPDWVRTYAETGRVSGDEAPLPGAFVSFDQFKTRR